MTWALIRFRQEVASSSASTVPPSAPVSLVLCPGWDQQWMAPAEAVDHVLVEVELRRVHLVVEEAAIFHVVQARVSNELEAASELDSPTCLSPRCRQVGMLLVLSPKAVEPSLEVMPVPEWVALELPLAVRLRGRDSPASLV